MEEKDPDHTPRPGVAEALDPAIGNGALWETDPHHFILRSIDPLIKLDGFLVDESTHQLIINQWNGYGEIVHDEKPLLPQTDSPSLREEDEKAPEKPKRKEKQTLSRHKIKKHKRNELEEENQDLNIEPDTTPSSSPPDIAKPKESPVKDPSKSIGKVGKRVRKVIKTVHEERDEDFIPENLGKGAASMDGNLSPFTQWLKSLRGSEYVHPYEDDYGLDQMSATARGGVSETFADLLASQGYRGQALEMYIQLMEKYPEKSSFFAAKIEALK